ncbi:MAG: hypothetical protein U0263_14215 [Polyangiaceae bacterium]
MRFVHGSFVLMAAMAGALGVAVACGGSNPPAETGGTEPAATGGEPASTAPAEEPKAEEKKPEEKPEAKPEEKKPEAKPTFKDMSEEQKKALMKEVVVPKLGAVFKEFDGKKYAEVNCVTCHGADAKNGKFQMPNPKLPKLDPKDGFAKHMKKHEKITKFMMAKVVGEMASALGVSPYNPETKQGFGCGGCHPMAEGK